MNNLKTAPEPTFELMIDGYMMHHMRGDGDGALVRIESITEAGRFGVAYVQAVGGDHPDWHYESPEKGWIINGGGFSYSWPAKEFRPVTDPEKVALVYLHHAITRRDLLTREANISLEHARIWSRAVMALRKAVALSTTVRTRET